MKLPESDLAPARNGLLFMCYGNTARSQMAEGFARMLGPAELTFFSAGSAPGEVHPGAIRAMKEVGINISEYTTKGIKDVPMQRIATIVTLCDEQPCPPLQQGVSHLHWPLPDPNEPAYTDEDQVLAFRRVRGEIRELISRLF